MKHLLIIFFLAAAGLMQVSAQQPTESDPEMPLREEFYKELRDYKHRFMARELDLSREQQTRFFSLYDRMEDETNKLNSETREMERRVYDEPDGVTDIEYDNAINSLFNLKIREGEIEKEYMEKFRAILSRRQLFMLKSAERNFNRDLMMHQIRLMNIKERNNRQ